MNRSLALFLAIAILIVHALAIHVGVDGRIAPPYDQAHVAYRIAYEWVHTGRPVWDASGAATEGYPSFLWVLVAWVGERVGSYFGLHVTFFCQVVGVLCTVTTALLLARFSPDRLAGVIAPLLFVLSGGVAAASLSGLETPLFALLVTWSFLAFERRAPVGMAIALMLACLTSGEGVPWSLGLFLLEVAGRLRGKQPHRGILLAFLAPLTAAILIGVARYSSFGYILSPWSDALLSGDATTLREGLIYLGDFVLTGGWTILLVFPLYYGVRRALVGTGLRAFLLASFWMLVVAAGGGDHLPFFQGLVPMFTVLFVAIQEAMTLALDSKRRVWPRLAWGMFLAGLFLSGVASKYPGDLGPLPVERMHRAWMHPRRMPRYGFEEPLGRLGLAEEIGMTQRLRLVGTYLREELSPEHRVLSPWPGALAYLSRVRVIDALGRTVPTGGELRPRPWTGAARVDVLALLAAAPEFVLAVPPSRHRAPTRGEIAREWLDHLDLPELADQDRLLAIRTALDDYEQFAAPVRRTAGDGRTSPRIPCFLLRHKSLGHAPELRFAVDGDQFRVEARHAGESQIVDLRVRATLPDGSRLDLEPRGRFGAPGQELLARSNLLLTQTGSNWIELARGTLPGAEAQQVTATLRNPGARRDESFAQTGTSAQLDVGR